MAKNFLFESFTDGVKINEVYFMQRRKIFDLGTGIHVQEEFGSISDGARRCGLRGGVL